MTRSEPWATVDDVKRELQCERTKATEIIKLHLGGFRPAGLKGWRCTWKAIREYKRKHEQGAPWHSDYPFSPEKPKAAPTGIATSARPTIDDSSERSTSETTEAPNQEKLQSLPSGTSKHELQMERLIAKHAQRKRSGVRSGRSPKSKQPTA